VALPTAKAGGLADLEIIVDTRGRYPNRFAGQAVSIASRALSRGDYGVVVAGRCGSGVVRAPRVTISRPSRTVMRGGRFGGAEFAARSFKLDLEQALEGGARLGAVVVEAGAEENARGGPCPSGLGDRRERSVPPGHRGSGRRDPTALCGGRLPGDGEGMGPAHGQPGPRNRPSGRRPPDRTGSTRAPFDPGRRRTIRRQGRRPPRHSDLRWLRTGPHPRRPGRSRHHVPQWTGPSAAPLAGRRTPADAVTVARAVPGPRPRPLSPARALAGADESERYGET